MKKLSATLILVGLFSTSAMACGGGKEKDDEKNGLKPFEEMTKVYCSGKSKGTRDKDDEKNG